jgi:putative ABC transport system ATP-binding protein
MRTVGQTLEEALLAHHPELGRRERRLEVDTALGHVGLSGSDAARFPANFSGGQRQRIAIARAVLARPALLILDEPTTYLDGSAVTSFLAELEELPEEPTVLIVTHSDEVGARAERLISMRDGTIEGDERRVPVARLAARRSARP